MYKINIPSVSALSVQEMREWCCENINPQQSGADELILNLANQTGLRLWNLCYGEPNTSKSFIFRFSRYEDAIHFKLRWY